MWKRRDNYWLLVLYLSCFWVIYIYFPGFIEQPFAHVFTQGGDGMVIYYDMIYHIIYGNDYLHFTGSNSPYGDSILLTDMQASLTVVLKFIHEHLYDLSGKIPGIIHWFIFICIPLTAVYIFKIGGLFKTPRLLRFCLAFLITFLSPQLFRIPGHFGLAYPFLIPMAIYWFIKKFRNSTFQWSDLSYGFIIFFFLINNPYLGFAASSLLAFGGLLSFSHLSKSHALKLFMMGFVPILLGYLAIHFSDPHSDRLIQQWGFFHYFASIGGMFFPENSILHPFVTALYDFGKIRFEGKINVGFMTTLTTLYLVYFGFRQKWFSRTKKTLLRPSIKYLLWSSFFIFLYAANYSLYGFAKPFLENHLGPLLMFKASGRLAWTLFYTLGITTMLLWAHWLKHTKKKKTVLGVMIIGCLIWLYEDYSYMGKVFVNNQHENPYSNKVHSENWANLNLNSTQYQGILMLPLIATWNDKVDFQLDFKTQYCGSLTAYHSGLPLLNPMLSRASLSQTISAIQFAGHPVLPKDRLKDLDPNKKILIARGNVKQTLTEGEAFILSKAKKIGEFAKGIIYEIALDSLILKEQKISALYGNNPIAHFSGKDKNIPSLSAPYAFQQDKGERILVDYQLPDSLKGNEKIHISLWHYSDYDTYAYPSITVETDNNIYSIYKKSAPDYYGQWVRQEVEIPFAKAIKIKTTAGKKFFYDDIQIRLQSDTTWIKQDGINLWNNYPVIKKRK